ncbi:GNAT family N-acetyltransferase [Acidihalobacter aeolianus]|nr:GNAT family N-acetyltransferase [Acidihalobacter aeolianus]
MTPEDGHSPSVVREAQTDEDISRCYAVMRQLRPHLVADEFIARVRSQMTSGFRLAMLEEESRVCAVAGFRIVENLSIGRHLYVDDLVTDEAGRSQGFGTAVIAWLDETARRTDCLQLVLDSGVQRFDAHRFYLRAGFAITAHHLTRKL